MKKKNVKKYLLMVVALMLMCVVSVAGTLAYLSATTEEVTNTFAIGDLFDKNGGKFELKEHLATYTANGGYTLKNQNNDYNEEVTTNRYDKILPGVDVPKDPFVRVSKLLVDAYLFIEVVGLESLPSGLSGAVDTSKWVKDTTLAAKHNGVIYRYVGDDAAKPGVINATQLKELNILSGQKITVAPTYAGGTGTVTFYGYIIQAAGIADAATAWGQVPNPASGQ